MKLAYFVLPHIGGTYSVFKHLRSGLASFGIDVRWLGTCEAGETLPVGMQDEMAFGTLVPLADTLSESGRARRMADAIESGGYDGIIINVLGDRVQTNIARYLPEHILRIMVVHNITPGTYAAAKAIRDHVHVTVCVAERGRRDLVERHGFSRERTHTIANAIDTAAFLTPQRKRPQPATALRVLFVGRIEDASKGVMWLRDIMDNLPEAIGLTIVGDGPDLPKLKRRMAVHGTRVRYAGAVHPQGIPAILSDHDILVMPSRFEGLPMTLIEAMATGCVPVVSDIRGVTDTIIDSGRNGMLFPVGNYTAAAGLIAQLNADRALHERMSEAAQDTIVRRYGVEDMASRYHDVISACEPERPRLSPVLELEGWSIPSGLRSGLRTHIPLPLKNWLRVMRERL